MIVDAWGDQRPHRPGRFPVGFYSGDDWADLAPVPAGGPFARGRPNRLVPIVLDVTVTPRRVALYAATPDQGSAVVTTMLSNVTMKIASEVMTNVQAVLSPTSSWRSAGSW